MFKPSQDLHQHMNYLDNLLIRHRFKFAPIYQKKTQTWLRKPQKSELGVIIETYVRDESSNSGIRVESVNTITVDKLIARNNEVLAVDAQTGENIYNQWTLTKSVAIQNYGRDAIDGLSSEDFSPHKKIATLKAIELTPDVLKDLGLVDQDALPITVSWSDEPMMAKVGDYLTDGGYSISAHDMKDYEEIDE